LSRAANLAYEDHGGGSEQPPIVFLHGAGGSRLHWPPRLRRLPGFRVLAPDLPGHGESPDGRASSIEEYSGAVKAWQVELGMGPAFVVGHSMGSAIALTLALEAPERVAGLALVGSGPRLQVNPAILDGLADPGKRAEMIEQILRWSFSRQAPPRVVELARRRMVETDPAVLARDFQACNGFDVGARLGEIAAPTLVVTGEDDRMTPPPLGEALAAGIPGARRARIPGAGHMVMLERPDAFEKELRAFLLEVSRGVGARSRT
jgi:pimeloyl-ACP methyl ester carboxylesterase